MADEPTPNESDDVWDRLARLPSLDDEPLDENWSPSRRSSPPTASGDGPRYAPAGQYHVPAPTDGPAAGGSGPLPPVPAAMIPDSSGGGAPIEPAVPSRRRRRRRWPLRVAIGVVVLLVLAAATAATVGWMTWRRVDKVDIPTLAGDGSGGTNYLIVGTDSRAGVDPDLDTAGGIFGDDPDAFGGARTDTIVVLRVADDGNRFLSINRDLWVTIAGGGEERINAAFNFGGPRRLVDTVQQSLGIPIHHYMEVDFAGFLGLVDTLGGIDVEVAHPAFDPTTGLDIDRAGVVHLEAEQALAYVRTRNYVEIIDGQQVRDPTSDFGRVKRQQAFLEAVFDEIGGTRNPVTLLRAARSLSGNVRIDDRWGFWEALRFGRSLDGLDPESIPLPVFDFTGPAGQAVLGLAPEAEAVLDRFR